MMMKGLLFWRMRFLSNSFYFIFYVKSCIGRFSDPGANYLVNFVEASSKVQLIRIVGLGMLGTTSLDCIKKEQL